MRRQFDSDRWFDHKGGQLHNLHKYNAISEKARLDKEVKAGTKHRETKQSSMLSICSRTKRIKDYIPDNSAYLHKEDKGEGSE